MGSSEQPGSRTNDDATVVSEGPAKPVLGPEQGGILGRYVVVEVIGEGGMGRVLRAYDPKLRREVALKLLRFEGDEESRARLIAEAQSMAQLSHPNVLPVYDFDFDFDGGRPFIAMEYVEGTTLRRWFEEQAPSRAEILQAFLDAGAGLAAAHAAGLVHCDFKPSNVLRGADGRIRVMDFGLASAALVEGTQGDEPPLAWSDDETSRPAGVMGTPAYMAPEQHIGAAVDARSDQYAFAVSLWEVLYGRRPFAGSTIAHLAKAKVQMRLETGEARTSVPPALRRVLLRGLAPDPADRFPSMEAMLDALRKDPARARRIVISLGLVVACAGGLGAWSLHREAARQASCREHGEEIRAVWGPQVAATVKTAFEAASPAYAMDTYARTRPWLDRYADQWASLRTDLCLRAEVDGSGGAQRRAAALECLDEHRMELEALVELLEHPDAEVIAMAVPSAADLPPLEPCDDPAFLATVPPRPVDATTRQALSELRRTLARVEVLGHAGRYEVAGARIEAALEAAETLGYEPLVAEALLLAARIDRWRSRYVQSRERAGRAFDLAARLGLDDTTVSAAVALTDLVGATLAEHDVGLTWARFGLTVIERRSWQDRPIHGQLLGARGHVLTLRAEYEEAIAAYERALQIARDTLGDEHPRVADSHSDLGSLAQQSGDDGLAIEHHQRALALRESILGPDHPRVADSLNNLGNAHWGRGELELAAQYLQRAERIKTDAYGPEHARLGSTIQNLGNVLYSQQRYDEAIAYWERALRILDATLPAAHPTRASILANLAAGHLFRDDLDAALEYAQQALEVTERVHGPEHPSVAERWRTLAAVHQRRHEHEEALRCLRHELEIVRAKHGESHERVAAAHRELGKLLLEADDRVAARVELEQAAAILQRANASAEARAQVDVQLVDALDPSEPGEAERRRRLASSAHAALCGDEAPSEMCAELEAVLASEGLLGESLDAGSDGRSPRP